MPDQPIREQAGKWLHDFVSNWARNRGGASLPSWVNTTEPGKEVFRGEADSLLALIDPDGKLNELPPLATRFSFDTGDPFSPVTAELTCRAGEGPHAPERDTWAVRRHGRCLNADGDWEFEPQPSSRDDEFLVRTRWTRDEAIKRARGEAARALSERMATSR